MQVGSLMAVFEVAGFWEVTLHHVDEAIVVLDGAARVLDEERAGFPEAAADLGAEKWVPLAGEGGRKIYNGEIHYSRAVMMAGEWVRVFIHTMLFGAHPCWEWSVELIHHVRGISSIYAFQ